MLSRLADNVGVKHIPKLTGAKRREWMGIGVAGMIITSDYGIIPSFPAFSTSKKIKALRSTDFDSLFNTKMQ